MALSVTVTSGQVDNAPPSASATVTPNSGRAPLPVTFDGSGSTDSDGSIVSYVWDFGDGSNGSGITDAHTYTGQGSYQAVLTVTDDRGATATTSVFVFVDPPNQVPVVDFTATPLAGRPPLDVSVDAVNSYDPEGGALSYGGRSATARTASTPQAQHTYGSVGIYTLMLVVTDPDGGSASMSRSIVVSSSNLAPHADAGVDQSGEEGTQLFFSGVASTDSDGSIASYRWDWGDGSTPEVIDGYPYGAHTFVDNGTYVVTLSVTDDGGATASDTAVVTVANVAPSVSFDLAASRVPIGATRSYHAGVQDPGVNDVVVTSWDFGDGGVASGTAVEHAYAAAGPYTITVTSHDADGGSSSVSRTVQVAAVSADAGPDVSSVEGATVQLGGPNMSPSDPFTTIDWDFGDGSPHEGSLAPSHQYRNEGVYVARVTVSDEGGTATSTATVTVTNGAPTITSMFDSSPAQVGEDVSYFASASDPGPDDVLSYSWVFGDGGSAVGARPVHRFAAVGTYTTTLTVTDGNGGVATRTRTVRVGVTGGDGRIDSRGTNFWLGFDSNIAAPELTLFITAERSTSGNVDIWGLGVSIPFTVVAGTVTPVVVPGDAMMAFDTNPSPERKAIHVTADDDVTLYGLNRVQFTTDAFLGLPVDALGTDYVVMAYADGCCAGSEASVVATADNTTVHITPKAAVGGHPAGETYDVTLALGDTYQLVGSPDLTGTAISSDKPVSVFGGHFCADVPTTASYCDHIIEQMTPTTAWGRSFVTSPLASRANGDTFRVLAATDDTTVRLNGAVVATLARGEFYEQIIDGASTIDANNPILVAQYSNGSTYDDTVSDPFMVLVPPFEQFLGSYVVSTPATGFSSNFINVVAPTSHVGDITLDGAPIPATSFSPVGSSAYSAAEIPVALGTHALDGSVAFGVSVYGFDSYDSYGYPGGLSMAQVATVDRLSLTPATENALVGTDACVVAAVVNTAGSPVSDVRVDFDVTGANPATGFASTNSVGQATYCYHGSTSGDDQIVARVSDLTARASKTWSNLPANHPPVADSKAVSTPEDVAVATPLSGTDADSDPLTYTVVTPPAHGTLSGTGPNLTYTPAANFNGSDSFTFTVNDGHVDSAAATVSITVTPVNDAPTAADVTATTPRATSTAVSLSANDIDGDALTFTVVTPPAHGTLTGTGANLTYSPDPEFEGLDSFTYRANDGSLDSNLATASITVTHINHPPVADSKAVSTPEDVAVATPLSGTDADSDPLTYTVVTPPAHGTLSGTAPNLTYTPAANFNGSDSFSFKVNDGHVDSPVRHRVDHGDQGQPPAGRDLAVGDDTAGHRDLGDAGRHRR